MGQPAQSALTFPSTPIALAASGLYILAACLDGVHVYDRTSSAWVQSLPYPSGVVPSPGQSITTAYNVKGSCVLFSGLHKVSTPHLQGFSCRSNDSCITARVLANMHCVCTCPSPSLQESRE